MNLPTGIKTNGKGKTTSHLNLTRTMADVWSSTPVQPSAKRRWDRDVWADQKIQFAGKEQ